MTQKKSKAAEKLKISYKQTKDVDRYIGFRIQTVRKARNMSQKELLQRLSKPLLQQALSRYENGITPIPANLLFDISQALGVTVENFMPMDIEPVYEISSNRSGLDHALAEALKTFSQYSKAGKKEMDQLEKLLSSLYRE